MRRGQTLYAPDRAGARCTRRRSARTPRACCPARTGRPSCWRFDLDADGEVVAVELVRALRPQPAPAGLRRRCRRPPNARPGRGRERRSGPRGAGPTDDLDPPGGAAARDRRCCASRWSAARRRQPAAARAARSAVDGGGVHGSRFRPALPAEDWNAQLSLMTGMAAATIMLEGRASASCAPCRRRRTTSLARFRRQAARARASRGRRARPTGSSSAASTATARPTWRCCTTARRCSAAPATPPSTASCAAQPRRTRPSPRRTRT